MIYMQQGTDEWHNWRLGGVCASDAPIIMGDADYHSVEELWKIKTLQMTEEKSSNYVMELGHRFEPKIRGWANIQYDLDLEPECVTHREFSWVRASLDGYDDSNEFIAEIKYTGAKSLDEIESTQRPLQKHWAQVQHQFLATGFKNGLYIAYNLNKERSAYDRIVCIKIKPDYQYITETLFPKIKAFWDCVLNKEKPR